MKETSFTHDEPHDHEDERDKFVKIIFFGDVKI